MRRTTAGGTTAVVPPANHPVAQSPVTQTTAGVITLPGGGIIPIIPGIHIPNPIGGATDALGNLSKFVTKLGDATTYVRIGEFVAGGILVFMGLKQLANVLGVKIPGAGVAKTAAGLATKAAAL